jgi:hypothetical protein
MLCPTASSDKLKVVVVASQTSPFNRGRDDICTRVCRLESKQVSADVSRPISICRNEGCKPMPGGAYFKRRV